MQITRIAAFQVDLPLHEGNYAWSGGKSVDVFDSTIVRVESLSSFPRNYVPDRVFKSGNQLV